MLQSKAQPIAGRASAARWLEEGCTVLGRFSLWQRLRLIVPPMRMGTLLVATLLTIAVLTFVVVEANLDATVLDIGRIEAQQDALNTVQQAIESRFAYPAESYFKVTYHGSEALVQPNTPLINRTAAQVAMAIQRGLRTLAEDPIDIPLGQALGSKLLAAYGPTIPVTLVPYGAMTMNFRESFKQAGINQTLFVVYLDTDTTVQIVIPMTSDTVHIKVSIPIAQEVFQGPVPTTYVVEGTGGSQSHSGPTVTIPIGKKP